MQKQVVELIRIGQWRVDLDHFLFYLRQPAIEFFSLFGAQLSSEGFIVDFLQLLIPAINS